MAKTISHSHKRVMRPAQRQTNWVLIGGMIAGGILILAALLIMSTQQPEKLTLEDYCHENPSACFSLGSADAPVKIVEIADFGCTHCRDFHVETFPSLEAQYVENEQVQFILMPYALSDVTLPAANAGVCAGEQGEYFAFAAAMYAGYDDPTTRTRDGFLRIAQNLDLDMDAFEACVAEARYNDMIRDNIQVASSNGVSSTPTFFINGTPLKGAFPLATFQQQIESQLGS
jgi:protein-disulfide isomerase